MFILSIFIQSLLIIVFAMTGGSMLVGAAFQVEAFKHLGLSQWFRSVTAIVQFAGVTGLIIGFWFPGVAAWAGVWLSVTMLAAFLAHLKAGDPIGKAVPAFILAIISIILMFIHLDGLLHPFSTY